MIPYLPDGKQPTNDFDGITNVSVFFYNRKISVSISPFRA